ncbi:MAG: hypothetical protein K5867_11185 [Bacteroidales bacterium]|nr:hypothetical protein [Bacteroidales bacterium]
MTLKRLLFRISVRGIEKYCLMHQPEKHKMENLQLDPLPSDNHHTDIITIAFNNHKLIPIHNEYIKKYFKEEHTHIVCDNSTDKESSKIIQQYCHDNKTAYIKIPANHLRTVGGSYSHACALNWVYQHVIKKRKPHYFGITDHDLFPIKAITITDILDKQHIYGPLRKRGDYWYLSAILSFFDNYYLDGKHVDFMPVRYNNKDYLDTGGGFWNDVYSKLDISEIHFCSEKMENFREGDCRHQDQVEIFDEKWIHTINGSYWKKISIEKENIIPDLIKKYEER